jgi:recombination protein RecA
MSTSSAIRLQIENALADRIPSALTPASRVIRPVAATGILKIDELLEGGLPLGAISEAVGPECSGRTSLALSYIARMTQAAKVCAWVDVLNVFHPESAAAIGVGLASLLWVRCGVPPANNRPESTQNSFTLSEKYFVPPPIKRGLHGGGFGSHPRGEVKGLSGAVDDFLKTQIVNPKCAEPQRKNRSERERLKPAVFKQPKRIVPTIQPKPWARIEQALRVTDLLLQTGGFSAIVLDMGSVAPEYASRVPLATWFRYRAAAERTQASILLLTQHPCAKSSAELVLNLQSGGTFQREPTVFTGIEHRAEVSRRRFSPAATNIIPLKKPPQRTNTASWQNRTSWAGRG